MSFPHRIFFAGALALGLLGGFASAAEKASLSGDEWIKLRAYSLARPEVAIDDLREKLLFLFKAADIDGGGVSDTDYLLQRQLRIAQSRSAMMTEWLRRDLDGDGEVTRAEVEASFRPDAHKPFNSSGVTHFPTPEQVEKTLRKLVGDALKADGNQDGVLTFAEALAAAHDRASKARKSRRDADRPIPMSLDQNGDGVVSEGEFIEVVDRVLGASIDKDGDGTLSKHERSALADEVVELNKVVKAQRRARRQEAERLKLAEVCQFPKAPRKARIARLSAYEGQALSTVSLGGDDVEVLVADAWIEAGAEPLYVMLSSHSAMIWRFSGAVERIAFVVAGSQKRDADGAARVGVVGLPKERVFFPKQAKCLGGYERSGTKRAKDRASRTAQLAGRAADIVLGHYDVSMVKLPSGVFDERAVYANAVDLPETGPGVPLWREMLRYNPGGLVRIDASTVVSPTTAKDYDTLPQEAGLAQLLEEGALQVIGTTNAILLGPKAGTRIVLGDGNDTVVTQPGSEIEHVVQPGEFLIVKKIRFPAGLSGAHHVRFRLSPGVPKPEGSPGHSKVAE